MAQIKFERNTLYFTDQAYTAVLGVVDSERTLWIRDNPDDDSLWNEGRYEGLRSERL